MTIYFSPSAHAFFHGEDRAPSDAVKITPARHRSLLAGQSGGATIVVGPDGHPRLERARKPGVVETRAQLGRLVKREAHRRIIAIAPLWRQLNDLRAASKAGAARFAAIDRIREASSVIEAAIAASDAAQLIDLDVRNHSAWSEIDA